MSCGQTPAYLGSARGLCGDDDVTYPVCFRGELGGASGGSVGTLSRRTQKADTKWQWTRRPVPDGAAGAETQKHVREPQAARDPGHAGSQGKDLEMKLERQSPHLHRCAH